MLAIEKWGKKFFKPMVQVAQVVAISAEDCHEVMQRSREPWLLGTSEARGIRSNEWLALYRQPLALEAAAMQFLEAPNEPEGTHEGAKCWPAERRSCGQFVKDALRKALTEGGTQEEYDEALRAVESVYRQEHLLIMGSLLRDDEPAPPNFRQWFAQPAFVFLMSVAMPCWLEYRDTPWNLYLRARRDDFDALLNLLKLDAELMADKAIAKKMFHWRKTNIERYRMAKQAAAKGRTGRITLADVKYSLGGLLLKWSQSLQYALGGDMIYDTVERLAKPEALPAVQAWREEQETLRKKTPLRCELKCPDIQRLFNAVYRDRGQGLRDPDFGTNSHSVAKRLNRNAERWPSPLELDIFRAA